MCPNENITIPEGLDINSKNIENFKDPFVVQIKVRIFIFLISINSNYFLNIFI